MPSTYTSSLRLTLPATGELTNLWGSTVNTGVTSLVDSAIAGTAVIPATVWGGAGVAYTLSNSNGVSDESRSMFISATGNPAEDKNVICPTVSKLYFFRNSTSFTLTLKTAAGTGIAVPAGQNKILYCNGTDVLEGANAFGSLNIDASGNVGIGTNSPVSTLGRNITLYNDTSTGTVTDNAYLLVQSLNRNSILGLSGSATSTNAVNFITGGAAYAAVCGDTANNALFFRTGGLTERMRLDASGNLGVGTSSPGSVLDVRFPTSPAVDNGNGLNALRVWTTAAMAANAGGAISLGGVSSSGGSVVSFGQIAGRKENATSENYASYLQFITNGSGGTQSERMRIDSSGNLGLGVTPSAWSGVGGVFELKGNAYIYSATGVLSSGANAYFNGTNWIYKTTQAATRYEQVNGQHQWSYAPSGTAGDPITFTQAMTLAASGALGFNGANYGSSGQVLTSAGSGAAPTWTTPASGTTGAQDYIVQSYGII